MKTGVLNRFYIKAKNFFKEKEGLIKLIAILVSIAIAFIFIADVINKTNTFGGLKEWYTYRQDVYDNLTSILEENIVNDPYMDLQKLSDTKITYTCNYYSENQRWEVRLSEEHRWVSAKIVYLDGMLDIQPTYSNEVEYFFQVVLAHVFVTAVATAFVFTLLVAVFAIIWALFKLICMFERLIMFLKKKSKKRRKI